MSARLFVGNLPFDVTESELRELFSPIGTLSYVFLPLDRETGKKRGFAFVEFADEAKASEALNRFKDQQFKGRPLAISEARAKDARPAVSSPVRTRVPRLPDAYDQGPGVSEPSRRDRRGRDTNKRHMKAGGRNAFFDGFVKKKPRPERVGGRVYGLDADDADADADAEDSEDFIELEEDSEN